MISEICAENRCSACNRPCNALLMLPSDGKEGHSASCDSISLRSSLLTATGTELCVIRFCRTSVRLRLYRHSRIELEGKTECLKGKDVAPATSPPAYQRAERIVTTVEITPHIALEATPHARRPCLRILPSSLGNFCRYRIETVLLAWTR